MRVNWNLIKLSIGLVLIGALFGFSNQRNNARNLSEFQLVFVDDNEPFITHSSVNKLLIQNNDSVTGIAKESLVLREMEQRLVDHPMVLDAQVFVTIDGRLGALVEQRNPIGRIAGSPHFYMDDRGKEMPLSQVRSARVPLVTGATTENFEPLYPLLIAVDNDEFMKQLVVGIHKNTNGTVELRLRKYNGKVLFGEVEQIEKKFQNFKAFYQKTKQDNTLTSYGLINLQFGDQVVATKN